MPSLSLITTTAGRAAILAAVAGPTPLVIDDAQLSDVDQSVGIGTTSLTDVVATISAVGSVRPAGSGHALHIVLTDDSSAAYDVRTIAVRLDDGTFLMVYSQAGILATKAAGSSLHLAFDLTIDADTAATLDFGDTDYYLPAAGESSAGLIEIATTAEVDAGVDIIRAVTPYQYARRTAAILTALIASAGEVDAGVNTTKIVTPAEFARRVLELIDAHVFSANVVAVGDFDYSATKQRTYILPLNIYVPYLGTAAWDVADTTDAVWSCTAPASQNLRGSFQVPSGCKVNRMRFLVRKQSAGGSISVTLSKSTHDLATPVDPTLASLGSASTSATGYTVLTITPSAHSFDPSTDTYRLVVIASTSGGLEDQLITTEVRIDDPGPRNMVR